MRGRESVYYMTDSELRAYKRRMRRQRSLRNRLFTVFMTICLIAVFAVSYCSIKSSASIGRDQLQFKYYTSITVQYGETLWDIADDYIDYNQYKDKSVYIAEVQSINHLDNDTQIRAGQSLIVPYYSSEFVK
ncbi:MAG: LysM peptidoglycan-binding domain-containing protein [Acetatifactor sp.]